MKKPTLTLMCGLPRSGKTTWIQNNKKKSDIIVSPDDIRLDFFGHTFHKNAEPMIWTLTEMFVKMLLKQKVNIILDACHLTINRNKWVNLGKENGYLIILVILNTPLKICLQRNKKDKKIPIETLKNMSNFFDLKNDKENFDKIITIQC